MQQNKNIDGGNAFEWGKTSKDYARYRDIYPVEFYQKIIDLGLCKRGQSVLDLGTGTGVLPRNLHKFGAKFTGSDISENQISEAIRLSREQNIDIDYVIASAETIDFPDNSFDVMTACQCFIYFDQNIVFPKMHKLLKNSGIFSIIWAAWLPFEDEIASATEKLVLKYNPEWSGCGYVRQQLAVPDLAKQFFDVRDNISFDIKISFTRESWNGRIRACRGIGASKLSSKEISDFEKEHISYLQTVSENLEILHNVSILNLQKIN